MTFRPFRTGEFVDLGGVMGTVQNVQIFSTTLKTADGKIVVVPNGKIIAGNIVNFARTYPPQRVHYWRRVRCGCRSGDRSAT